MKKLQIWIKIRSKSSKKENKNNQATWSKNRRTSKEKEDAARRKAELVRFRERPAKIKLKIKKTCFEN